MSTPAKAAAGLKKDVGKLKKFLAAAKKFLAKEFLWLLFTITGSVPLALLLAKLIRSKASHNVLMEIGELMNGKPLFILTYILVIAGVYFSRTITGAIKTLIKPKS